MGTHRKTISLLAAGILAGVVLAVLTAAGYHYAGSTEWRV